MIYWLQNLIFVFVFVFVYVQSALYVVFVLLVLGVQDLFVSTTLYTYIKVKSHKIRWEKYNMKYTSQVTQSYTAAVTLAAVVAVWYISIVFKRNQFSNMAFRSASQFGDEMRHFCWYMADSKNSLYYVYWNLLHWNADDDDFDGKLTYL